VAHRTRDLPLFTAAFEPLADVKHAPAPPFRLLTLVYRNKRSALVGKTYPVQILMPPAARAAAAKTTANDCGL
jgi:hypothetical protein